MPTWSTPSAPHERAGQEAKSHISPICNYVSSRERDVCMYRGRCLRVPYMYAVAWRAGGFEALRARTCTFTVPLVLAPCWIWWLTRPDLHKHVRRRGGCPARPGGEPRPCRLADDVVPREQNAAHSPLGTTSCGKAAW